MKRALETGKEFPKMTVEMSFMFFGFISRRDEFVYYIESDNDAFLGYDEELTPNSQPLSDDDEEDESSEITSPSRKHQSKGYYHQSTLHGR
jgi:hypothetical protein